MVLFGSARRYGRWLRRIVPAVVMMLGTLTHAKADPRIDQETGPATTAEVEAAQPDPVVEQRGVVSWYGAHWRGRRTASGKRFDDRLLTAASLSLPLATRAHVTNLQNGRSVDVVVNDRGPYVGGRIMDLSAAAAAAIGMRHSGLAMVAIRIANPAG
jgi:peptidoglycan lytic transglycosylase